MTFGRFPHALSLRQDVKGSLEQDIERRIRVAINRAAHRRFGMSAQATQILQGGQHIAFDRQCSWTFREVLQLIPPFANDSFCSFLPNRSEEHTSELQSRG